MKHTRSAAAVIACLLVSACGGHRIEGEASSAATSSRPSTSVEVAAIPQPTEPVSSTPEPVAEASPATNVVDTTPSSPPPSSDPAPAQTVWPPYQPVPGVSGLAALTGLTSADDTTMRPALAVKIDNHAKARPQWGLEGADIVIEENVEGVTRFIAVFHSRLPDTIGPVRSARSGDLALLASFNRPVLGWSGGNPGVTRAVRAAADAGVLVDLSALRQGGCYWRAPEKRIPHNLVLDPVCASARAGDAGAARAPWTIDAAWVSPAPYGPDSTFGVPMDGVEVAWTWEPELGLYVRSQDGAPHLMMSGVRVMATNVLVLEVRHTVSTIDTRSPEPVTIGTGDGVLHRDGLATLVHWSRPTATDLFSITTRDGTPVALAPGNSFVELMRAP